MKCLFNNEEVTKLWNSGSTTTFELKEETYAAGTQIIMNHKQPNTFTFTNNEWKMVSQYINVPEFNWYYTNQKRVSLSGESGNSGSNTAFSLIDSNNKSF